MTFFTEQIRKLTRYELICFFNLVFFDKEELGNNIIKLIKSLDQNEQEMIFNVLKTLTDLNWLYEELSLKSIPTMEELIDINKSVEEAFNTHLPVALDKLIKETEQLKETVIKDRNLLKSQKTPFYISDQMAGLDFPPIQKIVEDNSQIIQLPTPDRSIIKKTDIFDCMKDRASRRQFHDSPLSLEELSLLLWATQGVRKVMNNNKQTLRNVPSGGSRHPFDTYLAVNSIEGLKQGIYRYQPLEHQIVFLYEVEGLKEKLIKSAFNQTFVGDCAVTFIWAAVPYRTEWRYGLLSKKDILLDCGHICQNLYLACESINCGTCAICAYNQEEFDELLHLDGVDEFTVYLSPVGKV